jgi:predicted methyltransferase
MIVLSHYQIKPLLAARRRGVPRVRVSLDLNLSQVEVELEAEGVRLPDGRRLDWETVEAIAAAESSCFVIEGGNAQAVQFFSEETNRAYSLYPTEGAPTMLVSGIPMHRIKGTTPHTDTLEKIRAVRPVVGQVLDTATGLGYTAIEAAKTAAHVTTIELDPAALEVCRCNPWSQGLFDNPKISQRIGDSFEVVGELEDSVYTRIIHDPPAFALAGDLYSGEFYRELHRLLRNNGRLFHYVGDPESKSGHSITVGVTRRLEQAGFREVRRAPRAFGVVAVK